MSRTKRACIAVIACALAIFALVIAAGLLSEKRAQDALTASQTSQATLQQKVNELEANISSENADAYKNASGVDLSRKSDDDAKAQEMLKVALTFSDNDSYEQARKTLQDDYGIAADSTFLTSFMPQATVVSSESGDTVNAIDANGLNMSFDKAVTYVTAVNGGTYSYLADCTVSSQDASGSSQKGEIVITYDMDADGNVSNLTGTNLTLVQNS